MVAPLIIAAGISAAVSAGTAVYGGISSSNAAKAEAERAEAYGSMNAFNQRLWGQQQSQATLLASAYNAASMTRQAQYNAQLTGASIEYNVAQIEAVTAYNDLLFDDHINQIYDAAGLASAEMEKGYAKSRGSMRAAQAASGTTMDYGSNAGQEVAMKADEALYQLILEKNADQNVKSVLTAKQDSNWTAQREIEKMRYEGQLGITGMLADANANAMSTVISGQMTADQQSIGADNSAVSMINQAMQTSSNQQAQSSLYMTQGILQGTNTAVQAYGSYRTASPSAPDSLMDSSMNTDYGGIGGK